MSRHLRSRPNDRGATLIEYALGLSLFVLAVIGGIQLLADSASQRFSDGGGAGAPAEANGVFGDRTVPAGGGGGGGGGGTAVVVASASLTGSSQSGRGNDPFTATITVNATDETGAPVPGATVDVSWSGDANGTTVLTTAADGTVSHSVPGIRHNGQVTFSVIAVTLEGFDFTLPPPITLTKNS